MRTPTPTRAGLLFKARRIALNLTPAEIAAKIKTSERTVWRCEARGILPINKGSADAFLKLLGITREDIEKAEKKPTTKRIIK